VFSSLVKIFFDDFTSFIFAGGRTSGNDNVGIGSDTGRVFHILGAEKGLKGKSGGERIDRLVIVRYGIDVLSKFADKAGNLKKMFGKVFGAIVVEVVYFLVV
jgi:hypothetical protein